MFHNFVSTIFNSAINLSRLIRSGCYSTICLVIVKWIYPWHLDFIDTTVHCFGFFPPFHVFHIWQANNINNSTLSNWFGYCVEAFALCAFSSDFNKHGPRFEETVMYDDEARSYSCTVPECIEIALSRLYFGDDCWYN